MNQTIMREKVDPLRDQLRRIRGCLKILEEEQKVRLTFNATNPDTNEASEFSATFDRRMGDPDTIFRSILIGLFKMHELNVLGELAQFEID